MLNALLTAWYTHDPVFDTVLAVALAIPPLAVIGLLFMKAPYGRFGEGSRGVSARLGWFLMELPATVVFAAFYLSGPNKGELTPMILASIWTIHYANRGFLFPLLIRTPKGKGHNFGWLVLISGMIVTSLHGYLNGSFFSRLGAHFDDAWLEDPRFLGGVAIYFAGLVLNVHSDAILRNLRTPEEIARGDKVYRVPAGGGFELVSSPAYLGELIMWLGFALFTWSLPGVFILSITAANLIPRALANHRWYLDRFADYPRSRRALIPWIL
jgi:3-oxo-5-alpha-steroid 4-dehydrogenase 1